MKETTITAQELENIVGYNKQQEEILSNRRLLAHQIHEYEGGEMPKAEEPVINNHPKIHLDWENLTDEDFKRISMAKAQGFEEEFLSWVSKK